MAAQKSLRACGLYKFLLLGSSRAHPILLQMLINYWDPNIEAFQLDAMPLRLEVEDVYFITRLSRYSEVGNLRDRGVGGGLTIDEYIAIYFLPDTKKVGSQVLLNTIWSLNLKVIVIVLARIAGLESLR